MFATEPQGRHEDFSIICASLSVEEQKAFSSRFYFFDRFSRYEQQRLGVTGSQAMADRGAPKGNKNNESHCIVTLRNQIKRRVRK